MPILPYENATRTFNFAKVQRIMEIIIIIIKMRKNSNDVNMSQISLSLK